MPPFTEFVVNGHYYTSPNQNIPPPIPLSDSPVDSYCPNELRRRIWAVDNRPYLPFILKSPFHGLLTRRLAAPLDRLNLEQDRHGYHISAELVKKWQNLEKCLRQTVTILASSFAKAHPGTNFICLVPADPSDFGYLHGHSSEQKARSALSKSLDAFVVLLAYLSFYIALHKSPSDPSSFSSTSSSKPRWFEILSAEERRLHPAWLDLLADSSHVQFSSEQQRNGAIVNVARCTWLPLVPYMLRANVPIWLYWGAPPAFVQPLDRNALIFAPRSHPQSPSSSTTINLAQPVPPSAPIAHAGTGQHPGETWREYLTRQNQRMEARRKKETQSQRQSREGSERSAAKKSCPGKKGPSVYIWEKVNDVRVRTLIERGAVEDIWDDYTSSQKIFNSLDNCWDCCSEFNADAPSEAEPDSDSDDNDDIFPRCKAPSLAPAASSTTVKSGDVLMQRSSLSLPPASTPATTMNSGDVSIRRSSPSLPPASAPAHVQGFSCQTDPQSGVILMSEDNGTRHRNEVLGTPQPVVSSSKVGNVSGQHPTPELNRAQEPETSSLPVQGSFRQMDYQDERILEDDSNDSPLDVSRQDVLDAYSFVALDLEQMPLNNLEELVYYRFGFSLNEEPYTGIPSSVKSTKSFRSWVEVCRAVGGDGLDIPKKNWAAVEDFLSILAGSPDPFQDVPGKYWDLNTLGLDPLMNHTPVFISIDEKVFNNGTQYFIRPFGLHPSRDTSWYLSVDAMTALECIRRNLGPHTLDIANFLIDYGVPFRTLQPISDSLKPRNVPPKCRFLGNRSKNYKFDLADFAGYEALRDAFLRSQPHGPAALRHGGIIARLAREVLPNSFALLGPSADALSGHHARFVSDGKIFVDDEFSADELQLICGTYEVGKTGKGVLPTRVSWFPPSNIWMNNSGYEVGQWNSECEKWFQNHVLRIRSGHFQPLSSAAWRSEILATRIAKKLHFQMKKAGADYISARKSM